MKKEKMNTKNLVVAFCTVALFLVLVSGVSAAEITNDYSVEVNGIEVLTNSGTSSSTASVVAGDEFIVRIYFTSDVNDTDVTIEATVEGDKVDFDAETSVFDVEEDHQYSKVLVLEVPYELKDEISNDLTLSIKIDGKEHKSVFDEVTLRVQRPSYNVAVKSITTSTSVSAGEDMPVEVVLKNIGYNDLDDVYVTVSIPELGLTEGPRWFGDLVSLENCDGDCDEEDTVAGKLYLEIPYTVESGVYQLKVTVVNDDVKTVSTKLITVTNDLSENILVADSTQTVKVGEEASYDLLIVNPTDSVKVYRIITDGSISTTSQSVVAVPAGSSTSVEIVGVAKTEGKHDFTVSIFEGESLVETVSLRLNAEGNANTTIVVLTVILAVIFLALLATLIVLLNKKPIKKEEFGESYY